MSFSPNNFTNLYTHRGDSYDSKNGYNYKQILVNKYNEFKSISERYNETKFLNHINNLNNQILNITKQLDLLSPSKNINDSYNNLIVLDNKMDDSFNKTINNLDTKINHYIDKLIILNPLNLMKKGYAIVYKDDNVITSINNIKKEEYDRAQRFYKYANENT